jgi:hypothetical protein
LARVTRGLYGLLTALLGLGYAGAVLVLGQLAGRDRNSLAVAGGTLALAALVQPARRRIQQAVDRRSVPRPTQCQAVKGEEAKRPA